jgi:hypothetical protein
VLVLGLAFAIATTLTGLRTARAARERAADEATPTDDHRSL